MSTLDRKVLEARDGPSFRLPGASRALPLRRRDHKLGERQHVPRPGYFSIVQDLRAGTETIVGLYFNIVVPGVGPVVQDVGRIVFDGGGEVVFQAGPHQILVGEEIDFCELLP